MSDRATCCAQCRWVGHGSGCPFDPEHQVFDVDDPHLLERVWSAKPTDMPIWSVVVLCGVMALFGAVARHPIAIVAIYVGALVLLVVAIRARRRGVLRPAAALPTRTDDDQRLTGVASGDPSTIGPFLGALAGLVVFESEAGVTMVHGTTPNGFCVDGPDGAAVAVPPGPVWIDGGERHLLSQAEIADIRSSLEPTARLGTGLPARRGFCRLIRPGDTIEVHGTLERVPTQDDKAYRENAGGAREPVESVVRLRIVSLRP